MRIELVAPDAVFAGTRVALAVVIVSDRIVRIERADAELVGTQGFTRGRAARAIREEQSYPRRSVRLLTAQLLAAGSRTRCALPITLPADLPPTHALAPAFARLELRVHVAVAGGRDVRAAFPLPVRAATPPVVVRTPAQARTRASPATEPQLELSIASTRLVAGEIAVGSVALFHVDDRAPQPVELLLVPTLRLTAPGHDHAQDGEPHRFPVEIPAGGGGRMVTFQIRVPEAAVPTFRAATHELAWRLLARAGGRLELALPIEILDASAGASTAALTAAPRLADARAGTVLAAFAAHHGWRVDPAGPAITRTEATTGAELRLAYAPRGAAGAVLVASCRSRSLGLGLDVRRRGPPATGIALGIPAWDQRYQTSARAASQARAPLRAVVPSLLSAGVLGAVARWTDDELVLERPVAGLDAADLGAASDALARVAASLGRARELVTPPPELAIDLAAWRALARRWGGELRAGDLAIAGALDDAPVHVALRFDDRGAAVALVATVGPTPRSLAHEPAEAAAWAAPGTPELVELRVEGGAGTAAWPWPAAAAPDLPYRLDAARARTLVEALRAIVAALEPRGPGPYR